MLRSQGMSLITTDLYMLPASRIIFLPEVSEQKEMHRSGFTLVEMLVAMGIFTIVATIFASLMVTVIHAEERARAAEDLMDNVRFALDSMSKAIAVGASYRCIDGIANPPGLDLATVEALPSPLPGAIDCIASSAIVFRSFRSSVVAYRFNAVAHTIERSVNNEQYVSVTDPRVSIDNLVFYTNGVRATDNFQPRTVIRLQASITVHGNPIAFTLENIASQRRPDL